MPTSFPACVSPFFALRVSRLRVSRLRARTDKRKIDALLGKWTHGEARMEILSGETGRRIDAAERCFARAQRAATPYVDAACDKAGEVLLELERAADEFAAAKREEKGGDPHPPGGAPAGGIDAALRAPKAALAAATDGLRSVVRAAMGHDDRPHQPEVSRERGAFHRILEAAGDASHADASHADASHADAGDDSSPGRSDWESDRTELDSDRASSDHGRRFGGRRFGGGRFGGGDHASGSAAASSQYPLSYRGWAFKTRSFHGACRAHVARPTLRRFLEFHSDPTHAKYELRIFYYSEHADLFPAKLPGRVLDLSQYVVVCEEEDYEAERLGLEHRSTRGDSWWLKCPEANSFRQLHHLLTTITDMLSAQRDERMWEARMEELSHLTPGTSELTPGSGREGLVDFDLEAGLGHGLGRGGASGPRTCTSLCTPRSEGGASTETAGSRSTATTPRRIVGFT